MTRALTRIVVAWLALASVAPVALAQQPAPVMPSVPARVQLDVQVIAASQDGTRIDAELAGMAKALQRTPFTSFQLDAEQSFRLPDGGAGTVTLDGSRVVTLTLASHTPTEARVVVRFQRPGGQPVQTTLRVKRDRALLYVISTEDPRRAVLLKVDVRY